MILMKNKKIKYFITFFRYFTFYLLPFTLISPTLNAKTLLEIYQDAENNNPELNIAKQELEAVKEQYKQIKAQLLPSMAFDTTAKKTFGLKNAQDFESFNYDLSISQILYKPEINIKLKQAQLLIKETKANYSATKQDLIIKTITAYFNILSAYDNLKFIQEYKNSVYKQYEQVKQRFEVGFIAITDVQESKAAYDDALAEEINAENIINNAHEDLREITNIYYIKSEIINHELKNLKFAAYKLKFNNILKSALIYNPKLKAIKYQIKSAQLNIKLARTNHLPKLNLYAKHGYNYIDGDYVNQKYNTSAIGLNFNMQFDISGGIRANTRQAQIRYKQVINISTLEHAFLQKQLREIHLRILSDFSRIKALEQALISRKTSYKATVIGLEVGTRIMVDVIDSRSKLLQTQRDLARQYYDYFLDKLILKQLIGLLSIKDLQ
jgi:outer membrane protein